MGGIQKKKTEYQFRDSHSGTGQSNTITNSILSSISKEEILAMIADGVKIEDVDDLCMKVEMKRREELLSMHKENVWKSESDGRFRTYVIDADTGKRKLIARTTMKSLEDALCDHYREVLSNPTIDEIYREWISGKLKYNEITETSAGRYEIDYKRFFTDSGFAKKHIKAIDENDLTDFIKGQIVTHRLTQKSYSGLRILVKGIFSYAKSRHYTELSISNFFADLVIGKNAFQQKFVDPELEVLREDEIPKVKQYLLNRGTIRDLGVLLQLETGLRVGELASLKREDWKDGVCFAKNISLSDGRNMLWHLGQI